MTNRDAALRYATDLGWPVFPLHSVYDDGSCTCGRAACSAPGKHPRTINGCNDATTSPEQIAAWWDEWPSANVGIATGGGIVAVDIDPAKGGRESHAACVERLGDLGPTLEARTGSGGTHLIYHSGPSVVSNSGGRLGPGVDVRGSGGYIVAPPSRHASGGVYEWVHGGPGVDAIAVLTSEWIAAMAPRPVVARPSRAGPTEDSSRRQALRYLSDRAPVAVQGQSGSTACMVVMATLRRMGVASADDAVALCEESGWNARCVPPWPLDGSQGLRRKYEESDAPIGDPPRTRAPRTVAGDAPVVSAADVLREARGGSAPPPPAGDLAGHGRDSVDPLVLDRDPDVDKHGRWRTSLRNAILWVRHGADGLAARLALNLMTLQPEIDGAPLSDAVLVRLREWCESATRMTPSREMICDAVYRVADARAYHPIRNYLGRLVWDGQPRINRILTDILSVSDTEIHRAMLRCLFVGAVARAMSPGCKFDTVFVLVGPEDLRKSTFFSVLGGAWYSDSAVDLSKTDSYLQMHAAWIYEWSELDALTARTHNGRVKAFLSSASDVYRAPYGRSVEAHPRSTVIVGSLNPTAFLGDPDGDRRYHPMAVSRRINVETLAEWRDQLWAEALEWWVRHRADPADPAWRYWLSPEEQALRGELAAEHRTQDPWTETIASWVEGRADLTSRQIASAALMIPDERLSPGVASRIAGVMRRLGWKESRIKGVRGWRLPE